MDPELRKERTLMLEKLLNFLEQRRNPQNAVNIPHSRVIDLVKRLEEGLFRTAATQEEYLNLETLESRLHVVIRRSQMSNNVNSCTPLGTTISSTDKSVISDADFIKARRFMQEKILNFLEQRKSQNHDIPDSRLKDLVKRLEKALFRIAATQEEYLNMDTLESRLHGIIKRPQNGQGSVQGGSNDGA